MTAETNDLPGSGAGGDWRGMRPVDPPARHHLDHLEDSELADLGVVRSEVRFVADMTVEAFHDAETAFRGSFPHRRLSWWATSETRSRAAWVTRTLIKGGDRLLCRGLLAWLRFRRHPQGSEIVDLNWLLTVSQPGLEAWRLTSAEHQALLDSLGEWFDDPRFDLTQGVISTSVASQVMQAAVSSLRRREQAVLNMRYGLGDEDRITLDDSGRRLNITRERVRQIQRRALDRLSCSEGRLDPQLASRVISRLLEDGPAYGVTAVPASEAARLVDSRLPPAARLLLASYELEERELICASAGIIHAGRFVLGCGTRQATAERAIEIDRFLEDHNIQFPTTVAAFSKACPALDGLDADNVARSIGVASRVVSHRGYLAPFRPSRSALDAIELHERMVDVGGHVDRTFFGRRDPRRESDYPPGDLARRDFDAACDHPHLFMKLGDLSWLALKPGIRLHSMGSAVRGEGVHEVDSEEGTRLEQILEVVDRIGPARLATIRGQLQHIPHGSVHAIISIYGHFERVAPGTYTTTDCKLSDREEALLSDWQVRHYLLGRQCGELLGSYRAWTARMEYKWCKWARAKTPGLYPALLHFASIDEWPIDPSDVGFWHSQKDHFARDPGAPSIYPTGPPLMPDPKELLEVICMIQVDSGMNQLRVNRSLGKRPRISTAWSYMAVLIAAGWLEDQPDWYSWHSYAPGTEAHDEIVDELLAERMATGSNNQSSAAFLRLTDLALAGLLEDRCPWLRRGHRQALIQLLQKAGASDPVTAVKDPAPTLTLDGMLGDIAAKRILDELGSYMQDDRGHDD